MKKAITDVDGLCLCPAKTWKGVYAKLMEYAEQAKKETKGNDTTV